MDENLQKQVNKLRNLHQYKKKSDEEIAVLISNFEEKKEAKKKKESEVSININDLFNDLDEKRLGKELLDKYIEDFRLETISDVNLLKQLIYLEVFQKLRLQKTAEKFQKENNAVPLQILDSIHKNLDKIIELKNALHLTRDSSLEQNDGYKALQVLIKKAEIWRKENQVTRHRQCPHCGKIVLFIMRPDVWEIYKHPFFKDKIVGNEHLVYLYSQGKLTKEDLAKIFGTSLDYIDWLCGKWGVQVSQPSSDLI